MDKQHGPTAWAYIMDIQHVYMDMQHGHAEEKQHGHVACRHRYAAWTWSITQYGHAAWTQGYASLPWICGHEAWTWTC